MAPSTLPSPSRADPPRVAISLADPRRLLCEACGYSLEGLEPEAPSPECGSPSELSLPIRRRGSRWQRQPSVRSLVATNWRVLRHPFLVWSDVRLHEPRVTLLLGANIVLAALFPTLALLVTMCGPVRHMNARYLGWFFLGGVTLISLLTAIEFTGLPFFARQRGWRVPRDASFVIVAHASAAWIISGIGVGLVWVAWTLADFYVPALLARRLGSLGTIGDAMIPALSAAFITGMVVFSLLAGAGWRALRYANRLAPGEF